MKRIEERALKEFESSLHIAMSFEDIEGRLPPMRPNGERGGERTGRMSRRGALALVGSIGAAVLLVAVLLPTVILLASNQPAPAGAPEDLYENATMELLRKNGCLFFEELAFAEDQKNHVFVIQDGEIAEHYSYEKQIYYDGSFDSVRNKSMVEAVETIGIPSFRGRSDSLSLDYSFNDGYIRRVSLVREDGELTVESVETLDKENVLTWLDPDKQPLPTREQCEGIVVGMSLDEVVFHIGKPQREVGYGAILYQFDVDGGGILEIRLELDVERENELVHDNPNVHIYGTHFLYVAACSFVPESLSDVQKRYMG